MLTGALTVLAEGPGYVAVDKPAGRLVIPGRPGKGAVAAAQRDLRADLEEQLGRPLWVVHRLDRDTSGVLLLATGADAHRALSRAFERHTVVKRYLALVRGELFGSGTVEGPLIPIRGGRVRVGAATEPGAKASTTDWRALERLGGFTWVEFRPATGRLHQIRAHAASLGHPLAVDQAYGGAARLTFGPQELARVPLHAASLKFPDPDTGATVLVEAPLPPDLDGVMGHLRHFPSVTAGDKVAGK